MSGRRVSLPGFQEIAGALPPTTNIQHSPQAIPYPATALSYDDRYRYPSPYSPPSATNSDHGVHILNPRMINPPIESPRQQYQQTNAPGVYSFPKQPLSFSHPPPPPSTQVPSRYAPSPYHMSYLPHSTSVAASTMMAASRVPLSPSNHFTVANPPPPSQKQPVGSSVYTGNEITAVPDLITEQSSKPHTLYRYNEDEDEDDNLDDDQNYQVSGKNDLAAISSGGGSGVMTSAKIRTIHKLAERRRRREMKNLFDTLRKSLPVDRSVRMSKWEVLKKAIEVINEQKTQIHALQHHHRLNSKGVIN